MGFEALTYTDLALNRHSALRADTNWLSQQQQSATARFLPVWNNRNLVIIPGPDAPQPTPTAGLLKLAEHRATFHQAKHPVYLGHLHDQAVFCAQLDAADAEQANRLAATWHDSAQFIDLRRIAPSLPRPDGALLAYARAMQYWHSQHSFCSCCGQATTSQRAGHMRLCRDPSCGRESYPRLNPAVIMLVEQQHPADGVAKCLLGRHQGLPKRVYSTLAGYVDPGESLEAAVAREVMEEAGLRIENATYQASQPWPFPSAIMLGFFAQTRQTDIHLADAELEDARWFTRQQLRQFGEYGQECRFALPRRDSIARRLIDSWLSG